MPLSYWIREVVVEQSPYRVCRGSHIASGQEPPRMKQEDLRGHIKGVRKNLKDYGNPKDKME